MPKEVLFTAPHTVEVHDYSEPELSANEVRVRTLYSGISHGTERSHFRGEAIWLHKHVESDGFLSDERSSLSYPYCYGYEDVAEVIEVGQDVSDIAVGERFVCWNGHRETGVIDLTQINLSPDSIFLPIPGNDDDLEKYIFLALGTVALDGVLLSSINIGESAVIVGQGVVGILTMQLCKLSGAFPVIAVDLLDDRLETSKRLGADYCLNPQHADVGNRVREILGGHGADWCFEASGKTAGIGLALRCGTPFPRVVALGMYDESGSDLKLGEEFCRSSGQILHSRSGGFRLAAEDPTWSLYHRKWDIVRVNQVILRLLSKYKLRVDGLITHRYSLSDANEAYQLIDHHPDRVMKVIFDLNHEGRSG